MKFVLLPSAKDDLAEIHQYLQQESPAAVRIVSTRIKQALLLLTEQPYIGHPTDDAEVLEWHIPGLPYSIPYRVIENQVQIYVFFMTRNADRKLGLIPYKT
jgi:plasmid stabilization system protein ParE